MKPSPRLSPTPVAPIALALGGAAALALSAVAPRQDSFADSDRRSIAKELGKYFEARKEVKGINEAFVDLTEAVDKAKKKLKDTDPLALVDDWSQILFETGAEEMDDRVIKKGKIEEREFEERGTEYRMWAHVPADYKASKGPYPLILVVPEPGKKPAEVLETDWASADGRAKVILAAIEMPPKAEVWSEFNPSDDVRDGVTTIMFVFSDLIRNFAVDLNRVYLCGTSEGAGAALSVADAFPHRFAGVIGRGAVPAADPLNFGNLPVLFQSGGTHATEFADKAKELGYETCTNSTGGGEDEVWAWIDEHARNPYPTQLAFSPRTAYSTKAYWVTCEGIDVTTDPRVKVSVDREKNAVAIDASEISTLQLLVNDALLDLDEVITVTVNGKEHQQRLDRNLRTMVDQAFTNGDWGSVFTNTMTFPVTPKGD